jgi:hypothetical protein
MFMPGTARLGFEQAASIKILQRTAMPQIWMTYEELASMLDCTVAEARVQAHLERLDLKISHDGKTRAKLDPVMTAIFIERLKTIDYDIDRVVNNLRLVHGLLSECVDQSGRLTPQRRRSHQGG